MLEHQIWTEKYRPRNLSQIAGQRHIIDRLESFVRSKNIPNMLFAGPAGCGKTTAAIAIAKELYGNNWARNYLELNASDERGIDIVRHKIKDFARIKSIGAIPYKIICLDEADALTQDAQQALRRTMEKYTETSRFILICNYSSKIIEPIQSRCAVFRFKPLEKKDIIKLLNRISKNEKIKVNKDVFDSIYEVAEGDMRKAINIFQALSRSKEKITEKDVYDILAKAKPKDVLKMMKYAIEGKFRDARKLLLDMLLKNGIAGEDIIKEISKQVYDLKIDEREKVYIIDRIGDFEFRISEGADPQVQLEALIAQLALSKNNISNLTKSLE